MRNRNDGAVNNLMSSDTQKVVEFAATCQNLWSSPVIIAVGMWELYNEVGWPGILGLAVMFVFLPISGVMMGKMIVFQQSAAKETDSRIALVSEIIQGIRVIKLSAWTAPFLRTMDKARERELVWLKKYAWMRSITFGILMLVPLAMSIAIFGSYVGIDGDSQCGAMPRPSPRTRPLACDIDAADIAVCHCDDSLCLSSDASRSVHHTRAGQCRPHGPYTQPCS